MICWAYQFLPGTGRGTIWGMVEGALLVPLTLRRPLSKAHLHPDTARHGPPLRAGEDLS